MDYKVIRPHQGDKWYDQGAPREAEARDVAHLVAAGVVGPADAVQEGETASQSKAAVPSETGSQTVPETAAASGVQAKVAASGVQSKDAASGRPTDARRAPRMAAIWLLAQTQFTSMANRSAGSVTLLIADLQWQLAPVTCSRAVRDPLA
ncbi:hypothetical protein [Pseudophaeobacter leonis]|uniref:hypothetical protein n=1 Tax=Pseudophaeobacter leonis TaxID=1144477 RepID=UPI003B9868F3